MNYQFKWNEELFWTIVATAGFELAQVLYTFQPEQIKDWKTWAVSFAGAAVRAVAGAVLAARSR